MTGAILIDTRPDRMIRSAWRGDARNASNPNRAISTREATIDIISIAQQASPKVSGKNEFPRAQATAFSSVVVTTRSSTKRSRSSPSRSPRSMSRAFDGRMRKSLGSCSRFRSMPALPTGSLPLERPPSPHVYERDHQEHHEHHRLDHRERPKCPQLDGDRVQEDHLDVEQDEQHRDQVEADPEAEAAPDLRRQATLVGLLLGPVRPPVPQEQVQDREQCPDRTAQDEEYDRRQIRLEHEAV